MRADKQYPRQVYTDFSDWLRWHPFWIIGLIFGYAYYLATTEEV